MLRVLWPLLLIAFTIYNLVDCVQTKDEDVRGLPRLAWIVLILLFPLVGGIAWLVAGRAVTGGRPTLGPPRRFGAAGPVDRPRGPDDDPDFLRNL